MTASHARVPVALPAFLASLALLLVSGLHRDHLGHGHTSRPAPSAGIADLEWAPPAPVAELPTGSGGCPICLAASPVRGFAAAPIVAAVAGFAVRTLASAPATRRIAPSGPDSRSDSPRAPPVSIPS